ncbi:putative ABC transport system permease protein [Catalinimonas alkaloidigena]|uniref:ABC transporter permease n=1 Tax=Catalinimonas alkaloidigena TaxID=1075417 RepID=UPI002405CFBA|nr:ABC transporter permease [Catalinimonas alkaloidigena]MDF9799890.1 putative ABC transport system permease protein [Catalinimonas alkaloidigena]
MMYKSSLRNLWKNKSHTTINVLGLSLGITCSIVLFLLIRFWLSFDTYHSKADRIYRLVRTTTYQGNTDHTGGVPVPLPDALRTDFSDIEEAVFMSYFGRGLITINGGSDEAKNFQEEEGLVYIEPTYFKIFDRPLVQGNPATALDDPNEVVLSESMAEKYFGKQWQELEIVGQSVTLNKETELKITGIAKDHPENTDLPFEMLISYATVKDAMLEDGGWGSIDSDNQLFMLLAEEQSPALVNERLPDFMSKYDDMQMEGMQVILSLQPLQEVHFDESRSAYSFGTIPMPVIYSLSIIAAFMVLIACINFVNLATAIATKRAKEVGVRKALGSSRTQLMRIFMGEAVIITFISVLVALGAAELLLIRMNDFLELDLQMDLLQDVSLFIFLFVVLLVVSLLSGAYPSWVLTRFEPSKVLKTSMSLSNQKGYNLRRALVIFQFVIAQAFIIGTLVLISQTRYLRQADLGFNQKGIVSVFLPGEDTQSKKTLKHELLRINTVENVSLAYSSPSSGSVSVTSFTIDGDETTYHTQVKYVDEDYVDVYGLQLLAGTGLIESDSITRLVVNERFLSKVGISSPEEALERQVDIWGRTLPIVGVMKDFHTVSLRNTIEPTVLIDASNFRQAHVLINTNNISNTLAEVESRWKAIYPEYTFDYSFIDEAIAEFYEGERNMSVILSIASLVVIFIGCLGLYGLITFMAEQKTKEVGIRKVLGASVSSIVRLFSVEFLKLILIAFVVAAPLAYYVMRLWLQNFEYKIDLGIGLFAAGILITLLIALTTITYRSLQAARTNPAQALRND